MKSLLFSLCLLGSVSAFAGEQGQVQAVVALTDGVQVQFDFKGYGICSELPESLKTAMVMLLMEARSSHRYVEVSIKPEAVNPNATTGKCINAVIPAILP